MQSQIRGGQEQLLAEMPENKARTPPARDSRPKSDFSKNGPNRQG
jgi:hypothetical protein